MHAVSKGCSKNQHCVPSSCMPTWSGLPAKHWADLTESRWSKWPIPMKIYHQVAGTTKPLDGQAGVCGATTIGMVILLHVWAFSHVRRHYRAAESSSARCHDGSRCPPHVGPAPFGGLWSIAADPWAERPRFVVVGATADRVPYAHPPGGLVVAGLWSFQVFERYALQGITLMKCIPTVAQSGSGVSGARSTRHGLPSSGSVKATKLPGRGRLGLLDRQQPGAHGIHGIQQRCRPAHRC